MKCLNCNHKLPDDSEFCQYCGNKIEKEDYRISKIENEDTSVGSVILSEDSPSDNIDDIDVDNMTDGDVLNFLLKVQAEESVKAIKANMQHQPDHESEPNFGLTPENPIYTLGTKLVDGEREFLNTLCTSAGEKIKWERQGSTSVASVNGMIDIYDTYLPSGQLYKTIYINMYGAKKSTKAPVGFILNDTVTPKLTKPKKEKKIKTKYCSRCGSVIDKRTKICTGCGRKYFKFRLNKFSVAIIIMSVIITALLALNIFTFISASEEIDGLKEQVVSKENTIDKLRETNADISEQSFEDFKEKLFFRNYAVIVSDDGTRKYHKYGCDNLDTSYFWIYNTEAAEDKGYYACSKCCD